MKSISSNSIAEAWLRGANHLRTHSNEEFNLILEATAPHRLHAQHKQVVQTVDRTLAKVKKYPVHTVAETIFPAVEYMRTGKDPSAVFEGYPNDVYPKIETRQRWGNYAIRLLRSESGGKTFNPLQECISRINAQLSAQSPKRAIYELSLTDDYFDLPTHRAKSDRNILMGGPCLSHISLKIRNKSELVLTALYRNHFYSEKVLGNLLGLARLQLFICDQTGLVPGSLVAISTLAVLDLPKGLRRSDINGMLDTCTELIGVGDDSSN